MISDVETKVDLESDWIIVNDDFGSLCFVLYSLPFLNDLRMKNKDKQISDLNCLLISISINENSSQLCIDNGTINIAKEFENQFLKFH